MSHRPLARVLAACLLLACGGLPLYELPEERTSGEPMMEAPNPRTGELAWRSGSLEMAPDGAVRFEFTLMNGTTRDYLSIMLRIVLRGPDREIATVRYPAGPLAGRSSKVVRSHLAPPGFVVETAHLELIYAQE
ncbi:MAG: hypothetical protein ABFS41_07960 [Myxococcota bacterium]